MLRADLFYPIGMVSSAFAPPARAAFDENRRTPLTPDNDANLIRTEK
jgi:cbb3-type cytochrome oxidase subunit 3